MRVGNLGKIVLSFTSKSVVQEKRKILSALLALEMISGQKGKTTCARRSIAAFKLREKTLIGCKVTLRGGSMYQFLERLITIVLPRAQRVANTTWSLP